MTTYSPQISLNGLNSNITLFTKGNPFCANPDYNGSSIYNGHNYNTNGSCSDNQLQVASEHQGGNYHTWCLDGANAQLSLNTSCPTIGGQTGTPTFPTNIQKYNLNNDYQWCGDSPNSNFNLPCTFDTSNVISGWSVDDIINFTNKYQPMPTDFGQLVNTANSTNQPNNNNPNSQTEINNLIKNGTKYFCSKLSTNCLPGFENNSCPNLYSNEQTSQGTVGSVCQTQLDQNDKNTIMQNYCVGENLGNTECISFCTSNPSACIGALNNYCNSVTPGPQNDAICGCSYPSAYYKYLTKQAQQPYIDAGIPKADVESMITVQPCNYSPCLNSRYQPIAPGASADNCRSVCLQSVDLNNSGTINADSIKINQSAGCLKYNPGGKSSGQLTPPSDSPTDSPTNTEASRLAIEEKKKKLILYGGIFGGILLFLLIIFAFLYFR